MYHHHSNCSDPSAEPGHSLAASGVPEVARRVPFVEEIWQRLVPEWSGNDPHFSAKTMGKVKENHGKTEKLLEHHRKTTRKQKENKRKTKRNDGKIMRNIWSRPAAGNPPRWYPPHICIYMYIYVCICIYMYICIYVYV